MSATAATSASLKVSARFGIQIVRCEATMYSAKAEAEAEAVAEAVADAPARGPLLPGQPAAPPIKTICWTPSRMRCGGAHLSRMARLVRGPVAAKAMGGRPRDMRSSNRPIR